MKKWFAVLALAALAPASVAACDYADPAKSASTTPAPVATAPAPVATTVAAKPAAPAKQASTRVAASGDAKLAVNVAK